ncbi:MAG: TssN family type VI secretion system protein [Gammaproteobacteria bacterium]|nr:TssN family type VI secretion system protein [Gammaproteobacteria bacterium]
MEILLFTLVAIILYQVADGLLKAIEKRKGKLLENRSLIFFVIITVLALASFNLLQKFGPSLGLLPGAAPTEIVEETS